MPFITRIYVAIGILCFYRMNVVSMKPEMKGTLVDTDVEVDLDNSEEMKKKMGITSSSSSSSSSGSSSSSFSGGTVFSGVTISSSSINSQKTSSQTTASSLSLPGTMPAQGLGLVSSAGVSGLGSSAEVVPRLPAEPAPGADVIHVRVKTPTGTNYELHQWHHDDMT